MRRVVRSAKVYHLWANETQDEARNSSDSVSFHRNDAYSYGTIIGRIVRNERGERAFLVSRHSYSVTTSGHQGMLRHAIPFGATIFHVDEVASGGRNNQDDFSHAARLNEYAARVAELQGKAKRARLETSRADYLMNVADTMEEANAYARFFGIAETFDNELVERLNAEQEEARRVAEAEQEARRLRAEEEARIKYAERAEAWKNGMLVEASCYPDVLLRHVFNNVDGDMIETSKGATVPTEQARRLFLAWLNGDVKEGDRVGHYTVARVDNGDALQIGCHYIKRAEAERLATLLGWTAAAVA